MNDEEAVRTEAILFRTGWTCLIDQFGPIWVATWYSSDSRVGLLGAKVKRYGITLKQANRRAMSKASMLDPSFNDFIENLLK